MFHKTKLIIGFVVIVIIFLLSLPASISNSIKLRAVDFVSPLLKVTGYVYNKLISVKNYGQSFFHSAGENKQLRNRLSEAIDREVYYKEAVLENQRLKKLLGFKQSIKHKTIASKVIGRDSNTWFNTLIIDKGSDDGLETDLPVLGADGVIGRIAGCGKDVSTVLLITDTDSSIGSMIQDTRTTGLVEGLGTSGCVMNYIPKKTDVSEGALIVTSGIGSVFPKGLLIGKVKRISLDNQALYKIADIELASDIDSLEEVLVIRSVP